MRWPVLASCIVFWLPAAFAQNAAPAFEVASVKPAPPPTGNGIRVSMNGDPGRINYSNVSLRELIRTAYEVKDYQILGPDWLASARFDITAKFPEGATEKQVPAMLKTLLAERFQFKAHLEKKDLPAYALVIAKGGPKLKEFVETPDDPAAARGGPDAGPPAFGKVAPDGTVKLKPGGRGGMMMTGMGHMQARGVPIDSLVNMLSRQLDRPVVDETGLKAKYDIALDWMPEAGEGKMMMMGMPPRPPGEGAPEGKQDIAPQRPPLTVALQQQAGLKLDARKLPVDLLVIDSVNKAVIEN